MPTQDNERCEGCDRVFGTRIDYLETQLKEVRSELKALSDRENHDTTVMITRLSLVERDIKWWGALGGMIGGFGVDFVSKFLK
jgi:hypothetical protein